MATVAVFIALGGGAFAVSHSKKVAPKNSVVSKSIKDGQVTSADVADDGLTATDINEGSLGKVPSAAAADSAAEADHAKAADSATNAGDAAKLDGKDSSDFQAPGSDGWTPLPLNSGSSTGFGPGAGCLWTNYGGNFNDAAYYRDQDGVVHLRGLVKANDGYLPPYYFTCGAFGDTDATIGTLPDGYRPAGRSLFTVSSQNKPGRVDAIPDGSVKIEAGYPEYSAAKDYVSLDGITFRCGPSGANGCP